MRADQPVPRASRPATVLSRAWRWLLAPLHALERARGWRRWLLLGAELFGLGLGFLAVWWPLSLSQLPDIGDPFDVAEVERAAVLAPDRNAMPLYERAATVLVPTYFPAYQPSDPRLWVQNDWGKAAPIVRRWVLDNRHALPTYLEGADRPDAAPGRTGEVAQTTAAVLDRFTLLLRLAALEASRLRLIDRDLAGSWTLYRALLRTSRHLGRHQGLLGREYGVSMVAYVTEPILAWARDPGVDAALLRRALADLRAVQDLTAPPSMTVRHEYLRHRNLLRAGPPGRPMPAPLQFAGLQEPTTLIEGWLWLAREPERALRISRLYFARWLAECDQPIATRRGLDQSPTRPPWLEIQRVGPDAPAAVRSVDEPTLRGWIASSPLLDERRAAATSLPLISRNQSLFDDDQRLRDTLAIQLAEALYEREHHAPAARLTDLIGPDLPQLPESYRAAATPDSGVPPANRR